MASKEEISQARRLGYEEAGMMFPPRNLRNDDDPRVVAYLKGREAGQRRIAEKRDVR